MLCTKDRTSLWAICSVLGISLVHFTRSMHMEEPLGKRGRGVGGYWSEPEGGRTRLRTRVPVA